MGMITFNYAGSLRHDSTHQCAGSLVIQARGPVGVCVLAPIQPAHTQIVLHRYKALKEQGHMGMGGSSIGIEAEQGQS